MAPWSSMLMLLSIIREMLKEAETEETTSFAVIAFTCGGIII